MTKTKKQAKATSEETTMVTSKEREYRKFARWFGEDAAAYIQESLRQQVKANQWAKRNPTLHDQALRLADVYETEAERFAIEAAHEAGRSLKERTR